MQTRQTEQPEAVSQGQEHKATYGAQSMPSSSCASRQLSLQQRRLKDLLVAQGRIEEGTDWRSIEESLDGYTFAGKVASQVGGADISGDRSKQERQTASDLAMVEGARCQDWKENLAAMDFEERVEAALESFGRRPSSHAIMSDLLQFCLEERTTEDVEAHVRRHLNFKKNRMSPHQYVFFMQRCGAIEEIEYDCDGVAITDAMRQELRELGAPEEEIEDLSVAWHLRTTEVGKEVLRRDDPRIKIKDLLAKKPSRRATYDRVIAFCDKPRSMEEIFQLLQGDPGLEINAQGIMQCQPSAYVSHLEEAGALYWDKGWHLTEAGKELLRATG